MTGDTRLLIVAPLEVFFGGKLLVTGGPALVGPEAGRVQRRGEYTTRRTKANSVFSAINQTGGI